MTGSLQKAMRLSSELHLRNSKLRKLTCVRAVTKGLRPYTRKEHISKYTHVIVVPISQIVTVSEDLEAR